MRIKFRLLLTTLSAVVIAGLFIHSGALAKETIAWETDLRKGKSPHQYGAVLMDKFTKGAKDTRPVLFPHWAHREKYTCKACHTGLNISMKRTATGIRQSDIEAGKYCGKCHNGTTSFGVSECERCHSYGLEVKANRKMEDATANLPKDFFGNKVNWVTAQRAGKIKPSASVDAQEEMSPLDLDIVIPVTKFAPRPPDVLFPHKAHTEQLDCASCHSGIFNQKKGGNPDMSMVKIMAGQFCGVCHTKVAFPLDDCFRCHSQPVPKLPDDENKDEKKDDSKK